MFLRLYCIFCFPLLLVIQLTNVLQHWVWKKSWHFSFFMKSNYFFLMKSRWYSYRKQCSGFCSCPDSNWPPRYSYHGNDVYLFACSVIIAYSKTPLFFLPTLHSYCLSVHYHCSATEWHCCLEQKSLMSPWGCQI